MTPSFHQRRVLVLGYGNPGRQDDGLGPAAAQALELLRLPNVLVEVNYLLNIEDAALAAEHDCVLFIDAAASGLEPFALSEVQPAAQTTFTTHIVPPAVLLAICRQCYDRVPQAWLLAIRGYEFELREELTAGAQGNLELAVEFVTSLFSKPMV